MKYVNHKGHKVGAKDTKSKPYDSILCDLWF